jgi:hypothetical protein
MRGHMEFKVGCALSVIILTLVLTAVSTARKRMKFGTFTPSEKVLKENGYQIPKKWVQLTVYNDPKLKLTPWVELDSVEIEELRKQVKAGPFTVVITEIK